MDRLPQLQPQITDGRHKNPAAQVVATLPKTQGALSDQLVPSSNVPQARVTANRYKSPPSTSIQYSTYSYNIGFSRFMPRASRHLCRFASPQAQRCSHNLLLTQQERPGHCCFGPLGGGHGDHNPPEREGLTPHTQPTWDKLLVPATHAEVQAHSLQRQSGSPTHPGLKQKKEKVSVKYMSIKCAQTDV